MSALQIGRHKTAQPGGNSCLGRKLCARAIVGLPVLAAGCGSIFDPAPYQPVLTEADQKAPLPSKTMRNACPTTASVSGVFVFDGFADAAAKLCWLAVGYAGERNDIMRQKLIFDVPALALGVATLANTAFHGAKDATTALGFGTAAVAGASLYAGPGTRITAYSGAANGLLCASAVSAQMAIVVQTDWATPTPPVMSTLTQEIQTASQLVTVPAEKDYAKDLQTARDAAVKALTDLTAAQSLVTSGPGKLQAFSAQVVGNATSKVVTGAQSTDAVMTLIKSQLGSAGSTPTPASLAKAPSPAPALAPYVAPAGPQSPALIAQLEQNTAIAASLTKKVNDAWSGFTSCAAN